MQERRQRPRAPFEGWVEITTQSRRRLASGRDLSMDGMGLAIRPPAPRLQSVVTSEFALPGISLPVALEGLVVWVDSRSGRLGLRFDGVEQGLLELLDNYIAGRL